MAFPSNGINHHSAVKSEKGLFVYKDQLESIYKKTIIRFQHKGGTTHKEDVVIYFEDGTNKKLSLKQKRNGINNGSFDYVNTTKFEKSNFRDSFLVYDTYKNSKDIVGTKLLKSACSSDLYNISDIELTQFFIKNVVDKYSDIDLIIIDELTQTLYKVIPSVFEYVKSGGLLQIYNHGKDTQSKKVLAVVDDKLVDLFNLRIRFHLNNGNSKWIGLKKGSSNLVIKFQQDKVGSLI